jgi:NADH-quinone oxidoreductase subunit N
MQDWIAIFPQLLLAAGGFFILCVGAFWRQRPCGFLFGMALIAVAIAGASALLLEPKASYFLAMLEVGGYGRFFTFLFIVITAITLLFAYSYGKNRGFAGDEFFGLILFAALGMTLVASAIHWLIFFLGLEILSLSFYVLIAIRKDEPSSNEAGLKYFIMGVVASAFLTFGIAMIYAATGKMNIAESLTVNTQAVHTPMLLLGLSLILVGIGFKISIVPFHLWTPDVYQGAPAPITAFLSTGSKVALFAALLRFTYTSGDAVWVYCIPVLWILAAFTMTVGNITALSQSHVKRLLAYSSVAQMGYLLMALLAVKQNGTSAIMFYLTVYALMDLGAFGTLATLSPEEADLDSLEDYRGLGYSHPWRAGLLAICLFSLAGLPPTAGFIGKFALFKATLQAHFILLAVIGILTAIVSIYFYLKVIVSLYMVPAEREISIPKPTLSDRFAGGLILILILWLGLLPSSLLAVITRIVSFLAASI